MENPNVTTEQEKPAEVEASAVDVLVMREPIFLGRTEFDVNTQMYTFKDGSGALPVEMQQDVIEVATCWPYRLGQCMAVFGEIWTWKKRLGYSDA
jgi:uncharacterized protein YdeI (BOF family)